MEHFEERLSQFALRIEKNKFTPYDSEDEMIMDLWCNEALKHKIIEEYIYHPKKPYMIFPEVTRTTKTGTTEVLLKELVYTPDFIVKFSEVYHGTIFDYLNKGLFKIRKTMFLTDDSKTAFIDVKSEYTDRYGSYRDFRYIKRGMMQLYGIYVNKCIVISNKSNKSLLAATFTPTEYLFRPKRKGDSFLKVKVKKVTTIKEFIQNYGNKKNRK